MSSKYKAHLENVFPQINGEKLYFIDLSEMY